MGNELVPVTDYLLMRKQDKVEELLRVNMQGKVLGIENVKRINVPTKGATTWDVQTTEGEKSLPYLDGVIVGFRKERARFAEEYTGNVQPPTCCSIDMENGYGVPGGKCAKCEYTKWGSGKNGGTGCPPSVNLYIVTPDRIIPYVVRLNATSMPALDAYLSDLTGECYPLYGVVTRLQAVKDKSEKTGFTRTLVTPMRAATLSDDEQAAMARVSQVIADMLAAQAVPPSAQLGTVPPAGPGDDIVVEDDEDTAD